ncbi:hypothetical protein LTR99_010658 [Exophiala xenobiotica]|uniref:SMP domain-containing protein n=1 Tax=Vermiconidia calcicola TaxID=1690605 RepID=A0AAV9Q4N1_9PEZI|nr:hypothetical protein LTR92_007269 [Exophiala xenobiotica]KAK5533868.1 hypothetical protein LTR25_006848 [Vermiconidia calcicola]KAK5546419.1 hypothetical protein LTR23_003524 [Chaetothyriales sp. CCFEE 6169]KAK5272238.1 hypothetical protein LTR96_001868 [Exophiala xenobiotica]KAK5291805.1 hypothetical protein LTR99_010658 [Exophiala xenobiotica]
MSNQMTKSDAARIQSSQAKSGGDMSSSGFPARAQGAADRNANANASNNSGAQRSGGANQQSNTSSKK